MKTKTQLLRLRDDTSGNAMMFFAAALVPMMGCIGLGIDAAQWVLWKRQLHSAADLGALAGARALAEGNNVNSAVRRSLAHNEYRAFTIDAIENAPTIGAFKDDDSKVRVVLSISQSLPFSGMFLKNAPEVSVEAVAENAKTVPNCVITFDTASTGVEIVGSATVDMNCGLASNSNFEATTSDSVNAGALSAVGTVTAGAGVTVDTAINNGIAPIADPYSGLLPQPDGQTNCNPNSWPLVQNNSTFSPGCYQGLQIQSGVTVTLRPGTYLIGEKGIKVAGGATLKGTGVTLIFTNTSNAFNDKKIGTFDAAGTSTIQLTAPTSGTYAGIIMYQDPRTPDNSQNWLNITGNSGSLFEGAIYAPSVGVKFTGNSGINTNCMQIAAKYAAFEGNTSVTNNCPAGSGSAAYGGEGTVRLVG